MSGFRIKLQIFVLICFAFGMIGSQSSAQNAPIYNRKDKQIENKPANILPVQPKQKTATKSKVPTQESLQNIPEVDYDGLKLLKNTPSEVANLSFEEMLKPCTEDDMSAFKKMAKEFEILEYKNQKGLTEEQFQPKFQKAMEFFNNDQFMDVFTTLSIKCDPRYDKQRKQIRTAVPK
jgi:hypothetical protein